MNPRFRRPGEPCPLPTPSVRRPLPRPLLPSRLLPTLLLPTLLLLLALGPAPAAEAQDEAPSDSTLTCDEYCNPRLLRRPGVRLVLRGEEATLAADQLRLNATVFRDGFETGAFETFLELEPETFSTDKLAEHSRKTLGFEEPLELVAARNEDDAWVLDVEGLEPGLTYRWRVDLQPATTWLPGPTIRCMATVCPADYVDQLPPNPPVKAPATAAPKASSRPPGTATETPPGTAPENAGRVTSTAAESREEGR